MTRIQKTASVDIYIYANLLTCYLADTLYIGILHPRDAETYAERLSVHTPLCILPMPLAIPVGIVIASRGTPMPAPP